MFWYNDILLNTDLTPKCLADDQQGWLDRTG
jgi:hypothetical protein